MLQKVDKDANVPVPGWPQEKELPAGIKLNLGCGKIIMPKEDGWINIDKISLSGVDKVIDLFKFPWPFPDNYADYMIASHLVEHIPHQVYNSYVETLDDKGIRSYSPGIDPLDGFFCFFREVHRILKPTGFITVICPHAWNTGAVMDPTHTRGIVPESFGYLAQGAGGDNWDYDLGFSFEALGGGAQLIFLPWTSNLSDAELQYHIAHTMNVVHSIRIDLRPVK